MPDESKDLDSIPIEELEKMMEDSTKDDFEEESEIVPEPVPQEPEKVVEEAEPPAQVKTEAAETSSEPKSISEMEELKLKLEGAEHELLKWQKIAGKHGGEIGFLQNQIRQLREQMRRSSPQGYQDESLFQEEGEPAEKEARTPAPDRIAKLSDWTIRDAMEKASTRFWSEFPDATEDMKKDMAEYIKANGSSEKLTNPSDPMEAYESVKDILEEARHHVIAKQKREKAEEMRLRRAEQIQGIEEAKKKASITGSGSPPVPPPRPKSLDDLTDEELEKQMEILTPPKYWKRRR